MNGEMDIIDKMFNRIIKRKIFSYCKSAIIYQIN
jgi:hypothetical protein